MGSERYKVIRALLEDPLNLACVLREFERKDLLLSKLLPPPIPTAKGGWVFPSFSSTMTSLRPGYGDQVQDKIFEVYCASAISGWYVMNHVEDVEIGPFAAADIALEEAKKFAVGEGFTLLERMPWENEDVANYPL